MNKWKWFGSPGHFICSRWCRFHLCTQVGKFLISTVGEYVHPYRSQGSEQTEAEWLKDNWPGDDVGYNRKYETMVFRIKGTCQCGCGMPTIIPDELDMLGYNDAKSANEGHLEMCEKYDE